jgi:hypothetical protein
MNGTDLWARAFHEVGHTLIPFLAGAELGGIRIGATCDASYTWPTTFEPDHLALLKAMTALSGIIAEEEFGHVSWLLSQMEGRDGVAGDWAQFQSSVRQAFGLEHWPIPDAEAALTPW